MKTTDNNTTLPRQLKDAIEIVKRQADHLKKSNAKAWGDFRQRVLKEASPKYRYLIPDFWNLY
ncbi:MAG: hypothetical protein V3V84_00800 [Candidatus Bathyarchaeia archaeon]